MTVVLDGGLATELEAAGHGLRDRLWSARILLTEPDAIEAVHLAYFRAGARVATTASYQATVEGFVAAGLEPRDAIRAIQLSVELAARARQRYQEELAESGQPIPELFIAGSIGPYGAMLADGSEYRGDYDPGPEAMERLHRPRIEALIESGVDLLALETIPSIREAEVLLRLLDDSPVDAWLSYQCQNGTSTASGEAIEDATAIASHPRLLAVGVNCTAPRHVSALLDAARATTDTPLIAYPNGGDRWDATVRAWVSGSGGAFDPSAAAGWSEHGAAWIGGCCGTTPRDIAYLAGALEGRAA
jgi:homocysteine S-methyltransferase